MPSIFEDTLTLVREPDGIAPLATDGRPMAQTWVGTPRTQVRPRRWSTEVKMLAAAAAVVAGLLTAAFVTYKAIRDYARSSESVALTLDVLVSLHSLNADLGNNQTDVMAYIIDLHPARLQAIAEREETSRQALDHIRTRTTDVAQRDQLARLTVDLPAMTAMQQRAIAIRATDGPAAAIRLLTGTSATSALSRLGALLESMVARERQLFVDRQSLEQSARRVLVWTFGVVLLLFLGTTLLLFGHIHHDLEARIRIGRDRDAVRQFLESIITAIPHPILIKDAATLHYILVNPAMATLLGQPRESVLEKSDFTFFPPARAARARELDRQALASGTLATDVVTVPTAQRGERAFRTIRLPFANPTSNQAYLLTIAEDITDSLATQEQLATANHLLHRQASELRAANNELSSFSYTISHDLRTPLRAIDGFGDMLAEDYAAALDDRGRRYIAVIRESSQRMGALIDALLYFTRIGREALVMAPANMNQLVGGARETAAAAFPGVSITWDIGAVPDARGDRDLLRQVWTNLLLNAAKFSQHASIPTIEIRGAVDGAEVVYSVCDNGVGFEMQFYSKLFGLFQRLHTEAPYSGAGVGLAIVHRIIAHHGGRVWARGAPGSGASFFFALPFDSSAPR